MDQRKTNIMTSLPGRIKKYDTNELIHNTDIDSDLENELMVTGVSVEGVINWVIGIDIYTLLYLK